MDQVVRLKLTIKPGSYIDHTPASAARQSAPAGGRRRNTLYLRHQFTVARLITIERTCEDVQIY